MTFGLCLAVTAVTAVSLFLLVVLHLKDLMPDAKNSDAMLQIRGAAKAGQWRWPSDMHDHIPMKARLKDVGVLLLALFQWIMNDRKSYRPLVAVCTAAYALSIVLVFLAGATLWDESVALFVALLFAASLWNFRILLYGGYQVVALVPFLCSIWFLSMAGPTAELVDVVLYLLAGIAIGTMMFSSASSRKLFPIIGIAFLASVWPTLSLPTITEFQWRTIVGNPYIAISWGLGALAVITMAAIAASFRPIVRAIYSGHAPDFLVRNFMGARATTPLESYLDNRARYIRATIVTIAAILAWCALAFALSREINFHRALTAIVIGGGIVIFAFTMPDVVKNFRGFVGYWRIAKVLPHFPFYRENFRRHGIPYPKRISAGGWRWFPRFLWLFAPFHLVAALAALAFLSVDAFVRADPDLGIAAVLIALIGVSPILSGELSASPQVASTYYPALAGLLAPIGYGADRLVSVVPTPAVWSGMALFLAVCAAWNAKVVLTDIWPSRMAAGRLYRELKRRGISRFATYDTPYNSALVQPMLSVVGPEFEVRPINTLDEIDSGYVVIPGVTRYAPNLQAVKEVISNDDFRADPVLNDLIDSHKVEELADAKFKTVGSSPYWIHLSDIYSYLDLIHRRVRHEDRWRGHAWLVDIARIREASAANRVSGRGDTLGTSQ